VLYMFGLGWRNYNVSRANLLALVSCCLHVLVSDGVEVMHVFSAEFLFFIVFIVRCCVLCVT
jgi:hypothetical protein